MISSTLRPLFVSRFHFVFAVQFVTAVTVVGVLAIITLDVASVDISFGDIYSFVRTVPIMN